MPQPQELISQIPLEVTAEPDLDALVELYLPNGPSARMKSRWLPGRQDASLPAARLLLTGTDFLLGRASAGAGAGEQVPCTANGRALIAAADAAAVRTLLSLVVGTNVAAYDALLAGLSANVRTMLAAADYAGVRTALGLVPGTDVQAFHANLAALAGLVGAADKVAYFTGAGAKALADFTAAGRAIAGAADAAAQRAALGISNQVALAATYTFTLATASYTTEAQCMIFRAPYAMTVQSAYLLPAKTTTGSGASVYWESYLRNMTQSLDLCSSKWTSNGSELTAGVAKDLGANQNLNLAAGDVIAGTMRSLGAATNLQHTPWTWQVNAVRT